VNAAIASVKARWWMLAALLLLIPFVLPVPGLLERMHVVRSFGVAAHYGLPFVLVLLLYRFGPLRGRLPAAAATAFLLAAGCEFPQLLVGRHPRLQDAGVDLAGVLSAVGWVLVFSRGRRWGLVLFVAGLSVLPYQLREMPGFIRGEHLLRERFPLLADFEDDRELVLWGENEDSGANYGFPDRPGGGRLLSFAGHPGDTWPGVVLKGMPRDWSGYRRLVFEARVADGDEAVLSVRLDDFDSRRDAVWCGDSFRVGGEWRRCEMDLAAAADGVEARTFRLDDIDSLLLFLGRLDRTTVVQLDNISLE
jgi:hypothetical protein